MIARLLYWASRWLPCKLIPRGTDNGPYLERYFLCRFLGRRFYLHRFVESDADESLHAHPWLWAFSLVLTGWYRERILTGLSRRYGIRSIQRKIRLLNYIPAGRFHAIEHVRMETWTLFVIPDVEYDWCFLHQEFVQGVYTRASDGQHVDSDGHLFWVTDMRKRRDGVLWWKSMLRGKDTARYPFKGVSR